MNNIFDPLGNNKLIDPMGLNPPLQAKEIEVQQVADNGPNLETLEAIGIGLALGLLYLFVVCSWKVKRHGRLKQ